MQRPVEANINSSLYWLHDLFDQAHSTVYAPDPLFMLSIQLFSRCTLDCISGLLPHTTAHLSPLKSSSCSLYF